VVEFPFAFVDVRNSLINREIIWRSREDYREHGVGDKAPLKRITNTGHAAYFFIITHNMITF